MRAFVPWKQCFKRPVLERDVLFTDDTPVPLQVKGNGKVKKARLWVYLRGGPGPPLTAYDFSIDRSKTRPLEYLNDYQGYVHADAYGGYDELFKKEEIIEVGLLGPYQTEVRRGGFIASSRGHGHPCPHRPALSRGGDPLCRDDARGAAPFPAGACNAAA